MFLITNSGLSTGILLLCAIQSTWASGNLTDNLAASYSNAVTLGETVNVRVKLPQNVFFFLSGVWHAPNGNPARIFSVGNTKDRNQPSDGTLAINPTTDETCIARNIPNNVDTEFGSRNFPNSTSSGWGYSFVVDLYYSHDYNYQYRSPGLVCIKGPYITERRTTAVLNITVRAAANGATTTASPTPAPDPSAGPHFDDYPILQWPLSPAGTGRTFESSGAERAPMLLWKSVAALLLVVAAVH